MSSTIPEIKIYNAKGFINKSYEFIIIIIIKIIIIHFKITIFSNKYKINIFKTR